jgi:hypothetical protein
LRAVIIERHAVGGQAGSSSMIENYMGFPRGIAGAELAERARQQAVKFGIELLMMQEGVRGEFHDNRIWVDLADGSKMVGRANICATGVEWRRLGLPNEQCLVGAGLYYGAGSREAPLCRDQHVVVIGGGNSAGQAVSMRFSFACRKGVAGKSRSSRSSAGCQPKGRRNGRPKLFCGARHRGKFGTLYPPRRAPNRRDLLFKASNVWDGGLVCEKFILRR